MTMAALLFDGCAVAVLDEQFCSPIPGLPTETDPYPEPLGAACDNFLTSAPLTLTRQEWYQMQESWIAEGQAVECTKSSTLGDIKGEIEKLCSRTKCDYNTKKAISEGLTKLSVLGQKEIKSWRSR